MILTPTTRNENINNISASYTELAKKLIEESAEVLEQATLQDRAFEIYEEELILETLDVIQMCLNILNKAGYYSLLDEAIRQHNKKLEDRGWERDTSLRLEFKRE